MDVQLTPQRLQEAVGGSAAAFRSRVTLQPAGGEGTKVFPPTYGGAVYATEKRRLPGREQPVDCVLLDSVQSQANRMEEALQRAVDEGRMKLPVIEVDFQPYFPGNDMPEDMKLVDPVGKITSLQAPHRIADAILRDSMVPSGGEADKPFRHKDSSKESDYGQRLRHVSAQNATVLFELCPTALLFGMWDSTGPKGGLGAKFERAIVSEIVGVDAIKGTTTSSRIDPLRIQRDAGPLYITKDGGWTLDESEAKIDKKKPVTVGKEGRPSEANHGNVRPSLSETDRNGEFLAGGVTIASAQQTIVISLPALRRLRFPVNHEYSQNRDNRDIAGRTVLAALGLLAASLANEAGVDLRSRCLLYPEDDLSWELLDRKAGGTFAMSVDQAIEVFEQTVATAKTVGLLWLEEPLVLKPSDQLVKLVVKSQNLAAQKGGDDDEGSE